MVGMDFTVQGIFAMGIAAGIIRLIIVVVRSAKEKSKNSDSTKAHQEGQLAFARHTPREGNPHPEGTLNRKWDKGWVLAEKNRAEAEKILERS